MVAKIARRSKRETPPVARRAPPARFAAFYRMPVLLAVIAAAALAGAFFAPPTAFSIDDVLYIDMAEAMAERGSLDLTHRDAPEGAPVLTKSTGIVHVVGGRVIPQYPSGYAVFAAPFFRFAGVRGLILMNALAAAASLWLTLSIGRRLYADRAVARLGALVLAAATFFSGYVFAVWPHMPALAFVLAGALFTLKVRDASGALRLFHALLAGLFFGIGLQFRIDAVLLAAAAFFWLRLFAAASGRLSALALIAGMIPGLLLSAWLNQLKFGVFAPFFYGETQGAASAGAYARYAWAAAGAAAASLVFNVPALARRLRRIAPPGVAIAAGVASVLALLVVAGDFAARVLYGAYFLTFDMQAYDGGRPQPGLVQDEFGYWSFWGLPKKALIQSLPFVALALPPVVEFLRGRNAASHGFALLAIAAPIAFFSLKAWHGGMGFNMRYFLPCLPFIALLSAYTLTDLAAVGGRRPRVFLQAVLLGVIAALAFYTLLPALAARFATPLQMYPQLFLFALLLGALVLAMRSPQNPAAAARAYALSGLALGYAALLGLSDTVGYLSLRAAKTPYERAYEDALQPGSLVITTAEDFLVHASLHGVHVVRALDDNRADLAAAAEAYAAAGRCVYVHTTWAARLVGEAGIRRIAAPGLRQEADHLALFAREDQGEDCRLSRPGGL